MIKVGLRVVRSNDWKYGNEDSGEGHLGTVIRIATHESKKVTVCWDNGDITNHRLGQEDLFCLRVFDNAPVGVRHPGIPCAGCKEKPIIGFRFKCINCEDFDLCAYCYMKEKSHDPSHVFCRFDTGQDLKLGTLPPRLRRKKIGVFGSIRRKFSFTKIPKGSKGPKLCKGCDDEISGYRFKCLNCHDFDFCTICCVNENSHDPTHVFGRFDSRTDSTAYILCLRTPSGKVGRRSCNGCGNEIIGLRFMCLDCPDFYFCTVCYQNKTHNSQHSFAKVNIGEDYIANMLPLRAQSREVTTKGIFKDAIVVRGRDWPYGDKYGKENCKGAVLAINSSHRGSVEVGFPGSRKGVFHVGLNGLVQLKFVTSSSNGTYYPDHLPLLKFKSITDSTPNRTSKSESSPKSDSDDMDRLIRNHVDENQNARDNAHLDFVSMMYKDKMGEILANPRSIPDEDFHDHHERAIEFCLEAVSKVKPLTDAIIRKINEEISSIYETYKVINSKKRSSTAPAIGIDLGTTYCCVAVYRNQEVEVIPNSIGENSTLSHVAFSGDDIIVGEAAKGKAYLNPQDTIYDVKRMCGRHFDEEKIQKLKTYWPFEIGKGEDGKIQIKVQNKCLLPEQVITEILINLKESADIFLGDSVINAVVTVPAYFSPRQKALTKESCHKAGFNVLQFTSEPAAAAVAYGIHLQYENDKRICLIFDLGGGTFDVAVLELYRNEIKIKAIDGDPYLGGEDFDNAMIGYCIQAFQREHGIDLRTAGSDFERDKRLKRIKTECEIQKRYLSATTRVKVSMDSIHGEIPLVVPFTRDIFSELIKPSVDKCMEVVDQILNKCEMNETDIDDVMVVGGSSRIPYVQSRLSEKFGGKPLLKRIKPEEAVAHGAAILAFNVENPHACLPNVFILDSRFRSKPCVS